MKQPRLSRLELRVMDVLWERGVCSIREVEESMPERGRPAYSTVQTMIYRLEAKKAVRRVKKVGNAYLFEATISRHAAQNRLVDDFLDMFGGLIQPVMVRLVETEKLRAVDLAAIEKLVREAEKKKKQK
jgi:BlaI family penicillinase repressor